MINSFCMVEHVAVARPNELSRGMDLVHDHDRDDGHVSRIINNDGKRGQLRRRS